MMLRLDASKARSCPDGISVIVVATESTPNMVVVVGLWSATDGWHPASRTKMFSH